MKTVLPTSFDIKIIVHFELILCQTVTEAYFGILRRLHEAMCKKRPEICPKDWILHDYAPAHKALSVKQFLAQKYITEMEHLPCSANLTPNHFWLFPVIKCALKGRRFQDVEDIHEKT
jgi:hypothetical protein